MSSSDEETSQSGEGLDLTDEEWDFYNKVRCMEKCLDKAGLGEILGLRARCYPELCRQFLATYKLDIGQGKIRGMTFRYDGYSYRLTAAQIRAALGITKGPY